MGLLIHLKLLCYNYIKNHRIGEIMPLGQFLVICLLIMQYCKENICNWFVIFSIIFALSSLSLESSYCDYTYCDFHLNIWFVITFQLVLEIRFLLTHSLFIASLVSIISMTYLKWSTTETKIGSIIFKSWFWIWVYFGLSSYQETLLKIRK